MSSHPAELKATSQLFVEMQSGGTSNGRGIAHSRAHRGDAVPFILGVALFIKDDFLMLKDRG